MLGWASPKQFVVVHLRLIALLVWFMICCTVGLVVSLFRWRDSNLPHDISAFFGPISMRIAGVKLKVEGQEHLKTPAAIYLSNHQSSFDIFVCCAICPSNCVCIAKKSLKWVPLFGLFWHASGNIFIDRRSRHSAISSLDTAVERIRSQKDSVWIFPEGTRNKGHPSTMLPFKKGAFHMAIDAGCPLVPVVISPWSKLISYSARKWETGTLTVRALPPVSTAGMTSNDVDNLMARINTDMSRHLTELARGY